MIIRRLALALLAVGALTLTGCTTSGTQPSTSPASETPAPSSSTPPPVAIPTDCHDLVNPDVYTAIFGNTPLNDPELGYPGTLGAVEPTAPPANATPAQILSSAIQLHCIWRDPGADITFLEATVATVDAAVAEKYLAELPAQGYTCEDAHGGTRCELIKPNSTYPVDEGYTDFLRGNVYIYIGQANVEASDLLSSIVTRIWGK